MKLYIKDNKMFQKTFCSTKEINPSDIKKVEINNNITTVFFKSGNTLSTSKGLDRLFEETGYFVKNNIAYEDTSHTDPVFTASELSKLLEKTGEKIQRMASEAIKTRLGAAYDIDLSILGEAYYSILVFRLVENGTLLLDHPCYQEIQELGIDKAIDALDLSFLVKWAPLLNEGRYGVTCEVLDDAILKDTVMDGILCPIL